MIKKFRYFLLFAFLAFFNSQGFSQAVGTPYFVPTGGGTSLNSITFNYTGIDQNWVVPAGVTEIYVDVIGAQGTTIIAPTYSVNGGAGGKVYFKLPVTAGQTLYLTVGGTSTNNIAVYGGGGNGGYSTGSANTAGAGGGLSAISSALPLSHANAYGIAAGGGGGNTGYSPLAHGGAGGGLNGYDGSNGIGGFGKDIVRGIGATQTAGGVGAGIYDFNSVYPTAGTALKGGNGGIVNAPTHNGGGGGGAGYYGGSGGAGGGAAQGGGGGGSSWINPTSLALPGALYMGNVNTSGHGKITIYY